MKMVLFIVVWFWALEKLVVVGNYFESSEDIGQVLGLIAMVLNDGLSHRKYDHKDGIRMFHMVMMMQNSDLVESIALWLRPWYKHPNHVVFDRRSGCVVAQVSWSSNFGASHHPNHKKVMKASNTNTLWLIAASCSVFFLISDWRSPQVSPGEMQRAGWRGLWDLAGGDSCWGLPTQKPKHFDETSVDKNGCVAQFKRLECNNLELDLGNSLDEVKPQCSESKPKNSGLNLL